MAKRRWQDILKELQDEAHRDGYFGRKTQLTDIIDELVEELEYAGLLKGTKDV